MATIDPPPDSAKKHVHKQHLREQWNMMDADMKAKHLENPHNVKVYINAFIERGVFEEMASGIFCTLKRLGQIDHNTHDRKARKFRFKQSADMVRHVNALLQDPEPPRLLLVQSVNALVEAAEDDMGSQGWGYNHAEKYAFHTATSHSHEQPTVGLYYA